MRPRPDKEFTKSFHANDPGTSRSAEAVAAVIRGVQGHVQDPSKDLLSFRHRAAAFT